MPRIKKQGLDYFPLSTDFIHDRLVRRIMKREGDASLSVLIEVLSYIYAGEGYYVQADPLFYEDLSSNLYEKSSEDVRRIVALAVEYGVFDGRLFEKSGILTSADIQRQFLFSTKRRSTLRMEPDYCLVSNEYQAQTTGKCAAKSRKSGVVSSVKRAENVAIASPNVTPGTHSTAQNSKEQQSVAQYSVAEDRIDSPFPTSLAVGKGELPKEEGEEEEILSEITATAKQPENRQEVAPEKRREWSNEAIDELQPPADGMERNYDGLVYNLRLFGISPSEQYAIIRKSNFGMIGSPVWKGFVTLRDSCGKIKLPGRYLLSVLNR